MSNARTSVFALALAAFTSLTLTRANAPRPMVPKSNTVAAGALRDGVLSLDLDALTGQWPRDGGTSPSPEVEALAVHGAAPSLPAPLIRVRAGTLVRVHLRNTLARPVTLFLPTAAASDDSVVVSPGATGELQVRATAPGNFIYRATTDSKTSQRVRIAGAMAGAFIVDSVGASHPRDRVLVMLQTPDSSMSAAVEAGKPLSLDNGWFAFTINGRSWPNTERLAATVGDTVHWRIINATLDVHPMHLHGFFYRVDELSGLTVARDGQGAPGRMVVTERMTAYSSMSMTWVPERAGNWLLHCHLAFHLIPDMNALRAAESAGSPLVAAHGANHAQSGMAGLVMGINVAPRAGAVAGARAPVNDAPQRRLRLIAVSDSGFPSLRPSLHFVVEENARPAPSLRGMSPTLNLIRGQRVSITVVNHMREPTAVHWHGVELESYFDGVAGLSGAGNRLAPVIAPGDSFEVRFAPPRSGTFMYHSHLDDVRQQPAGLVGALIVRDDAMTAPADVDEHEILLKGTRDGVFGGNPTEIGGYQPGDTIVVHVGRRARFRVMSLASTHTSAVVTLTARPDSSFRNLTDTLLVSWTPVAKDGADVAVPYRTPRPARQVIGMGETYDFEFTPRERGQRLRIEVRGFSPTTGVLVARLPVRVE